MLQPEAYKVQTILTPGYQAELFWLVTAWKAQVYIITLTIAVFHFMFQFPIPVSQYSHLRGRGPKTPINEMQPWLMLLVTPVSDKSKCQLWERSIVLIETPIFEKDQQILEANGRVTKAETESAVDTKVQLDQIIGFAL